MAIKIIKQPDILFTMECERCGCVFTYETVDLCKYMMCEYVKCPCCSEELPHSNREKGWM